MKKLLLAISLIMSFSTYARSTAVGDACAYPTKTKLQEYIKTFSERSDLLDYRNKMSSQASSEIRKVFEDCKAEINLTGVGGCFENLAGYAKRENKIRNSDFAGFEQSFDEYRAARPKEALSLPEGLKNGLPSNYRELAKEKGWKVFKYRSRTVGNPGPTRSYNRVLILVEGEKYDKYVQFTVAETGTTPERLVDYISVDKSKNPKEIAFNQFWRDENGEDPKVRMGNDVHGSRQGFDTCFSCHPNGMRNLSPAPASYSKEDAPTLDYLNKKMDSYKKLDWGGAVKPDHDGPMLGAKQGCTRCHNGYTGDKDLSRGALTRSTSGGHIRHKITSDGSMPVADKKSEKEALDYFKNIQNELTEQERKELFKHLYVDHRDNAANFSTYYRILDWMKSKGKLSADGHKKGVLVLKGSDNYPDCLGEKDCYEGLEKRIPSSEQNLMSSYNQEFKEWALEKCDFPEPNPSVDDGERNSSGYEQGYSDGQSAGQGASSVEN